MTSSSIAKKFIFIPVVVSAAVFGTLTLPLNLFGSKPIAIKVQEEPIFFGQVEDLAPPYLTVAGIISVGAGIVSLAAMGWQQSSHKSAQVKDEISSLAQHLQEKQELLEALQQAKAEFDAFSDFQLDESLPEEILSTPNPDLKPEIQPQVELQIITDLPVNLNPVNVEVVAAKFTSAQTFLGYNQVKNLVSSSPNRTSEVEQLDTELQQIMERIISMRKALRSNPQGVTSALQQTRQLRQNFQVLQKRA